MFYVISTNTSAFGIVKGAFDAIMEAGVRSKAVVIFSFVRQGAATWRVFRICATSSQRECSGTYDASLSSTFRGARVLLSAQVIQTLEGDILWRISARC